MSAYVYVSLKEYNTYVTYRRALSAITYNNSRLCSDSVHLRQDI